MEIEQNEHLKEVISIMEPDGRESHLTENEIENLIIKIGSVEIDILELDNLIDKILESDKEVSPKIVLSEEHKSGICPVCQIKYTKEDNDIYTLGKAYEGTQVSFHRGCIKELREILSELGDYNKTVVTRAI
jgi:hypothetical protein